MERIQYQLSSSKPRVCCDVASTNAGDVIATLPLLRTASPLDADIIWVGKHYPDLDEKLKPLQALNYLPQDHILTDHDTLAKHLRIYGSFHRDDHFSYRKFYRENYPPDMQQAKIELYWLIASLDPLMVLVHKEGCGSVNPNEAWDLTRLQNYFSEENSVPPDFIEHQLKHRLKQCLAYTMQACIGSLQKTPRNGMFFGLYSANFILDINFIPWLTHIQSHPDLMYEPSSKQLIMPSIIEETVNIITEIQTRRHRFQSLQNLDAVKHFEWIMK